MNNPSNAICVAKHKYKSVVWEARGKKLLVSAEVTRRGRPREEERLQLRRMREGLQAQGRFPGTPEVPFPGRKRPRRSGIRPGAVELGPVVRLHVLRQKIPHPERFPGPRGDGAHQEAEAQVYTRGMQRGLLLLQRAGDSHPVKSLANRPAAWLTSLYQPDLIVPVQIKGQAISEQYREFCNSSVAYIILIRDQYSHILGYYML